MSEIEQETYLLKLFTDESQRMAVFVVSEQSWTYSLDYFRLGPMPVSGFFSAGSQPDFFLAKEQAKLGSVAFPNWSASTYLKVGDKFVAGEDVISCRVFDFIVVRIFTARTRDGLSFKKVYLPPLSSLLRLTDPMHPWGDDFYKFVAETLGRRK